MTDKKLIVLGLDGATWDFILPLIQKGELKTFRTLLDQSIAAPLRSTMPPTTIPAWQSMFSGLTPEKLGITDFFKIENDKIVPVTSKDFKGKMIWDIYPDLRFIVYNIPGTYPAYKINGIMITDPIGKWNLKSIYPPNLKNELETNIGDIINKLNKVPTTRKARINQLYILTKAETELFMYLYTHYPFDIFIFRYELTDYIAHWAKNTKEIEEAYKLLDTELEKILNEVDLTDSYLLIVSDHGVQPKICDRRFFINSWLLKQGYLKLRHDVQPQSKHIKFIERVARFLVARGLIDRITLARIYGKVTALFKQKRKSFTQIFMEKIDVMNSKAFAYNTSAGGVTCIRVNDPSILTELKEKLINVRDKDGIQVINNVSIRSLNDKLELVIESHPTYILNHEIAHEIFFYGLRSFKHSKTGIIIIHPVDTSNLKQRYVKNNEIRIFDVMPIICYMLDLPIPEQIDGSVPVELFKEYNEFANKQPKYISYTRKSQDEEKLKKVIMRLKMEKKI